MTCGIYLITNKKTNQKYVGRSKNIEKRWKEHLSGRDIGHSRVDNAISKYGKDNFSLSIITELPENDALLNMHEKYWITFYNTFNNRFHYNLTEGGDGICGMRGENHPFYGKHLSEETKQKISEAQKGKTLSDEHKQKISEAMTGHEVSDETKLKISEAQKGENHPFYGKHLSEETKQKMSEAQKGENNPQSKYGKLWDINYVKYNKYAMFKKNREPNPCKCFRLSYNGDFVNIGGFIDFLTPKIISNLIQECVLK